MVILQTPGGFDLLFRIRGSIVRDILRPLLATTALATLVTVLHESVLPFRYSMTVTPFSLIGLTLAIFLGFRNSVSYDRYWEGRKLWGELLNVCRSLARLALTTIDAPAGAADARPTAFVHRLIAFAHALRHHLRGSDPLPDLERLLGPQAAARPAAAHNVPLALLQELGEHLHGARRDLRIDPLLAAHAESRLDRLDRLADVLGGCERIRNTPLPYPYRLLLHRTVYFYCLLLPFGLIDTVGRMTPVVVLFLAYTFFGLDALGEQIEEPFGEMPHDLPLLAISTTIEADLLELLGERERPAAVRPVDGVLL